MALHKYRPLAQRIAITSLFVLCLFPALEAQQRSNPASMQSFQIPSHGALINAFVYVAAGEGPHPAVVLLHGFPGNERNLDLAQDIRRAGWDVLYFDYRGSWGSPGDFSFSHGIEDTAAAVDYLRSAPMAKILRLDPARIVLIGHSMGGFMAVQDAAADGSIVAVGLISAADLGGRIPHPLSKSRESRDQRAECRICPRRDGPAQWLHTGRAGPGNAGQCNAMELHGQGRLAQEPTLPHRYRR